MIRDVLIYGRLPDTILYLGTLAVSLFAFLFGYRIFMRYRSIFVDVI